MKILLVTNDFPPRVGGAQYYLWNIYSRLQAAGHHVTVLAPKHDGDQAFDVGQKMRIERFGGSMFWPTPTLRTRVRRLARDADIVAFGVTLPMAAIGPGLDRPCVYHTNGIEVAWTKLPGARTHLRRIGRSASLITGLSAACSEPISRAARAEVERLPVGVDLQLFHPNLAGGGDIRLRYDVAPDAPLVACISRLVRRKGQDTLLRAWPEVTKAVPGAQLMIVGGGPDDARLRRLAVPLRATSAVIFPGEVPLIELPAHHAAADVFAMPCRTRLGGFEVEGLGLVYLEAQACARPVVAGDSGGAPEALLPGVTGEVVHGGDQRALARTLIELLSDRDRARAMGARGRSFVEAGHDWDTIARTYAARLSEIK